VFGVEMQEEFTALSDKVVSHKEQPNGRGNVSWTRSPVLQVLRGERFIAVIALDSVVSEERLGAVRSHN
jgi:hypothetical protein